MKIFLQIFLTVMFLQISLHSQAESDSYSVDMEQISLPGSPMIHSFAFGQSEGKWLFIGGRTNGLHGFNAVNSFPKQYSNINFYVVDPVSAQTWSRNIFLDLPVSVADPFRTTNMQSVQIENKLYISGGFGYDSLSNSLRTFPVLSVIDVNEIIHAIVSGFPVTGFIRQITDTRFQVTGGEMLQLGDYFYLAGGHNFTGIYRRNANNVQVYSNQIKKFKIYDNGISLNISDYSSFTDTVEYHRRDMNLIPAIKPDGITPYMILYGGVFKHGRDLPFVNPIYIDEKGAAVDYSFEQKMSQYTCPVMPVYNNSTHNMHNTFFGGMSLYNYDEVLNKLVYDSLVPFINDITTITKYSGGASDEKILPVKFPELLGSNAEFILNDSIAHYDNGVIKLSEVHGRTFAGYIFGGIRALMPNDGVSYPSDYIFKVYLTPDEPLPVEMSSFTYSVNKRDVLLKWITSSENNNSGFEIQRELKTSGEWENITFIHGYGNTEITHNYFYEDKNLLSGEYQYRLKQTDFNGNFQYHDLPGEVIIGAPGKYILSQNYPNPFNPNTIINYELPSENYVRLKIYDMLGNEIKTLVNEKQNPGYYDIEFSGSNLSSGFYFYKLETDNFSATRKMLLVK